MGWQDWFNKKEDDADDSQAFTPSMEEEAPEVKPYEAPQAKGLQAETKDPLPASTKFEESDTATPNVKDYIAKKYNLADQYKALSADDTEVKQARKDANDAQGNLTMIQGLGQMFAGKHVNNAAFDGMRSQVGQKAKDAEADREHRLKEFLTAGQLRKDDDEQNTKDAERTELTDPTSKKSQLASTLGLSRANQLAAEAAKAGDTAGAEQFKALAQKLQSGSYSASDIGDMKLLDKVDYKDILNNNAAMERTKAQIAADKLNTDAKTGAEDRRTKKMGFDMEKQLVDQIEKDPVMKEAASSKIALDKAIALGGTPSGDEALTVMWNKGIDPISVVRESEFYRTEAIRGPRERYEMALQKLKGAGTLTPEIREELKGAMKDMQTAYAPYAKAKLDRIQNTIDHYELGADRVYGAFYKDVAGAGTPTAPAPGAAPAQAPAANPGEVTRKDPKTGKNAIFNSETKQFIRWAE